MLLKDKLKGKTLILASTSPRRRMLLGELGLDFVVADNFPVEEVYPADLPAAEIPTYLSGLKSDGYPRPLGPNEVLVTADTVVVSDGKVLGKPTDTAHAARMLAALSGRTHTVISGVTIRSAARRRQFSSFTDVQMRRLSPEEIEFYVHTFRPLDKAGAYGAQEWIGYAAIESINGSFYNVMGLPTQDLYVELKIFLD